MGPSTAAAYGRRRAGHASNPGCWPPGRRRSHVLNLSSSTPMIFRGRCGATRLSADAPSTSPTPDIGARARPWAPIGSAPALSDTGRHDRYRPRAGDRGLPRLRRGGNRGADDRAGGRRDPELVLRLLRSRCRRRRAGDPGRRARTRPHLAADQRVTGPDRWPSARVKHSVAAQGGATRCGAESTPRRGCDVRRRIGRGTCRGLPRPGGDRRLLVRDRLQRGAAGGARGRVHRAHVRRQSAPRRTRGSRGGGRRSGGGRGRRRGPRATGPGARERDEVLGRRDADLVRDVLGRRGSGGVVARRGRGAAGDRARSAARRVGDGAVAAACPEPDRERERGTVSSIVSAALAVWQFVVGDDWVTAIGVVVALGLTALIAAAGGAAWWVMPPAVIALLALSLRRAAR